MTAGHELSVANSNADAVGSTVYSDATGRRSPRCRTRDPASPAGARWARRSILRSRGSVITASETAAESVVCNRLTTPAGNPALCRVCTNSAAVSDVSFAFFMTTV